MWSAQVGKTEAENNMVGYAMSQDPSPILFIQPTLEMAKTWSTDRLAPMLRDTPILNGIVSDSKARDAGNTIYHKSFQGGHITMAGANSPASLASRPIRYVFFDEVDRYPESAGSEGDPVALGSKRTATFWNRKKVLVSTPTIRGKSRIEKAFLEGDQRRYFVPCPHCGEFEWLQWSNIRFTDRDPETAHYVCPHCEGVVHEHQKYEMLRKGEWRATATPISPKVRSYHINELYSPWRKWSEVVTDHLAALKDRELRKTWVNTSLAETWGEDEAQLQFHDIARRVEDYQLDFAPKGVLFLTAGLDTQDDRIACTILGHGANDETWVLHHSEFFGNPGEQKLWSQVGEFLEKPIKSEYGKDLYITLACIDSGGHYTHYVYNFARSHRGRVKVEAIHGAQKFDAPPIRRPTDVDVNYQGRLIRNGVKLWSLGVSQLKIQLAVKLQVEVSGQGYVHFSSELDLEYFEQLTSERLVVKYSRGVAIRNWEKQRDRNEALDCFVYAMAAAKISGIDRVNMEARAKKLEAEPESTTVQEDAKQQTILQEAIKKRRQVVGRRKPGGFATNF
jgi:phage terminase large subunit GpA-like protein